MFGLSTQTRYYRTALRKYTIHCGKSGPHRSASHIYEVSDCIWVPQNILTNSRMMYYTSLWTPLLGLNLIMKERLPWYMLEEHGGPITDHELQDAYRAKFPFGPP